MKLGSDSSYMVQWGHLDRANFDRIIEHLIIRIVQRDQPESEVRVINGRGGDGGIDVGVYSAEELVHIFQLKFFPEGFSGAHGRARKPQVRKSFESAMKLGPRRWTLVLPINGTAGEHDFVKTLAKGRNIGVSIWGQAKLDSELTQFPDLNRWAVRQPLTDTLKSIGLEKAALVGASDLHEAIDTLHQTASGRSPNWSVGHSFIDGVYTEIVRAKHAQAQQLEPISSSFTIEFNDEDTELRDRARRTFEYGESGDIEIPASKVLQFESQGPPWLSMPDIANLDRIVIKSKAPKISKPVEFQVFDEAENLLRSYSARTTSIGHGTTGLVIGIDHPGGTSSSLFLDSLDRPNPSGQLEFQVQILGQPATDVARTFRLFDDLAAEHKIRVLVDGGVVSEVVTKPTRPKDRKSVLDEYTELLVSDLAVIETRLNVVLPIPGTMDPSQRLILRCARLLLEGHCIIHPFMDVFRTTIEKGFDAEQLLGIADLPANLTYDISSVPFEAMGRTLQLGPARFFFPNAVIYKIDELKAAVREGSAVGEIVRILPGEGQGIKVLLAHGNALVTEDRFVTPWGLPGFDEHPEFTGRTPPPE